MSGERRRQTGALICLCFCSLRGSCPVLQRRSLCLWPRYDCPRARRTRFAQVAGLLALLPLFVRRLWPRDRSTCNRSTSPVRFRIDQDAFGYRTGKMLAQSFRDFRAVRAAGCVFPDRDTVFFSKLFRGRPLAIDVIEACRDGAAQNP